AWTRREPTVAACSRASSLVAVPAVPHVDATSLQGLSSVCLLRSGVRSAKYDDPGVRGERVTLRRRETHGRIELDPEDATDEARPPERLLRTAYELRVVGERRRPDDRHRAASYPELRTHCRGAASETMTTIASPTSW